MTEAQIHDLDIRCRHAVEEVLAGEYLSVFKGRGIEFEDIRPYEPGDEVRSIDWNVTARAGKPFVKRFIEERDLTIYLLVDISASNRFGSLAGDKLDTATQLAGLLAHAAVRNHDRAGLILFTGDVETHLPPGKGLNQVSRILDTIQNHIPMGTGTSLREPLDYLLHVTRRRCVVFLISDFQDHGFEDSLESVAVCHDLIAITIRDPRECTLPAGGGLCRVRDNESGKRFIIDASHCGARDAFASAAQARHTALHERLRTSGVDHFEVLSGSDYVAELRAFFQDRLRHRR
jgi:uncharacterized protein (DUF58 family)